MTNCVLYDNGVIFTPEKPKDPDSWILVGRDGKVKGRGNGKASQRSIRDENIPDEIVNLGKG